MPTKGHPAFLRMSPRLKQGFTTRPLWILCVSIVFALAAYAQKSPELPTANVELLVRAPGGQALVRARIAVRVLGSSPFRAAIAEIDITTDDRGVAGFEIPVGVYSLSVTAHKIGQGLNTGSNIRRRVSSRNLCSWNHFSGVVCNCTA